MSWLIPAAAALVLLLVGLGFRRWLAQDAELRTWRRTRRQYQQPDNVRSINRNPPSAA